MKRKKKVTIDKIEWHGGLLYMYLTDHHIWCYNPKKEAWEHITCPITTMIEQMT